MDMMARAVPFRAADEAWWWAWDAMLTARLGLPARRGIAHPRRACQPGDIIALGLCIHTPMPRLLVLAQHGRRGYAPEQGSTNADIWAAGMADLATAMRQRGWLTEDPED